MSYSNRTKDDNFEVDFLKLDCYMKNRNVSAAALSLAINKSRNWLFSLKNEEKNQKRNAAIIDLSTATQISEYLHCTIQDLRAYSALPIYDKDIRSTSNPEKMANAPIKDYREPLFVDYNARIHSVFELIEKMPYEDRTVLVDFLFYFLSSSDDRAKNCLKIFMLQCLRFPCDIARADYKYGSRWWVSLFLSELGKAMGQADSKCDSNNNKRIHIPDETELRRTFQKYLQKGPDNCTTSASKKAGNDALTQQLSSAVRRMIDSILEDADVLDYIVKKCVDYLSRHFLYPDAVDGKTVAMYKKGYF